LFHLGQLCFAPPEGEAQRCINLAHAVLRAQEQDGVDSPAIALNGANEVLVRAFLDGQIDFLQINRGLERVMERHRPQKTENLAEILAVDEEARRSAVALTGGQR
jgi:1-deoxy-D-xylulose-5-phosphate reductoisomerase